MKYFSSIFHFQTIALKTALYLISCVLYLNIQAQDTIPGVLQQPQWFIPIYFEDGNHDKDTIYLGYDPNSTQLYDSLYDAKKWIDTTKFHVNNWNDTSYYTNIKSNWEFNVGYGGEFGFSFHKGVYPLIVKWDSKKFNTASMPLDTSLIYPKSKWFISSMYCNPYVEVNGNLGCPYDQGISLVDTIIPLFSNNYGDYAFIDSLIIEGPSFLSIEESSGSWNTLISKYDYGFTVAIQEIEQSDIKVYPNPMKDYVEIESEQINIKSYKLKNIIGQELMTGLLDNVSFFQISTINLNKGVYFLILETENKQLFQTKLIKN